jgi:hypothetical protein
MATRVQPIIPSAAMSNPFFDHPILKNATKAGSLRIAAKIVVALFAATEVFMLISGNYFTIIMKELSN